MPFNTVFSFMPGKFFRRWIYIYLICGASIPPILPHIDPTPTAVLRTEVG